MMLYVRYACPPYHGSRMNQDYKRIGLPVFE